MSFVRIVPLELAYILNVFSVTKKIIAFYVCSEALGSSHIRILMPKKNYKLMRYARRFKGKERLYCSQDEHLSNGVKHVPSSRWDAGSGTPPYRSKPASCPELSLDSEKSVRCCNQAGKWAF